MSDSFGESSAPIDIHVPNAARIYDHLLGGEHNYEVDRAAAVQATSAMAGGLVTARAHVRANRDFLVRAVNYLVDEGIRQFLDVGTGIPNADNVAASAQAAAPESRIVSVDNDPTVLAHAHELLTSTPEGATAYIDGDLRHPAKILREAGHTLDFDRPIAVMLVAILHFFTDNDDPLGVVRRLVDAVPSGSYVALSHLAADIPHHAVEVAEFVERINTMTRETFVLRTRAEVAGFLDGLELVEPGIVPLADWRPAGAELVSTPFFAAIARKP